MKFVSVTLFELALAWLAYVYVGYPTLLWIVGYWKSFKPESQNEFFPSVSVLISARNEEKDIGWKIAETLNWAYPEDRLEVLIASDASEDRTDEIIRAMSGVRLKYLRLEHRTGKNEALNRLSKMATGEIFFFTDANSHIHPDCLRLMVRHFADPRVGCVTGADRTMKEQAESAIGFGERNYWGYESLIQNLESKCGSALICYGAIFCVRRSLAMPLQPDLANDLEVPIRIGGAGYAVLFEPEAKATEKATHSPKEEFNRRSRICGQGILGFWRLRRNLRGLRAWQFISRKLLRWFAMVPLALLFVSSMALASHPAFRVILTAQLIFYTLALIGWLLESFGCCRSGVLALPFYFVMVNLAAFVGVVESCCGRRYAVWEVATLTRGASVGR